MECLDRLVNSKRVVAVEVVASGDDAPCVGLAGPLSRGRPDADGASYFVVGEPTDGDANPSAFVGNSSYLRIAPADFRSADAATYDGDDHFDVTVELGHASVRFSDFLGA